MLDSVPEIIEPAQGDSWGGAREGAGRKPGSISEVNKIKREMQKIFVKKIRESWDPVIDAALDAATGARVITKTIEGAPRIYRRPPDFKPLQILMNRVFGNPVQPIALEGEDPVTGEPVKIIFMTHEQHQRGPDRSTDGSDAPTAGPDHD